MQSTGESIDSNIKPLKPINTKNKENLKTTPNGVSDPSDTGQVEIDYKNVAKTKAGLYAYFLTARPQTLQPYVDFFNLFAQEKGFPEVKTINDARKKKLKIRIAEPEFNFPEILRKAGHSELILSGTWFSFDWIIKNNSGYLKVLEGNYDKSITAPAPPGNNQPAQNIAGPIPKQL